MKHFAIAAALIAIAQIATALPAHAEPVCDGGHAIIRISQIKPGGTLDGIKKAIADHAKWYADHGFTGDRFTWGRVVDYDHATHTATLSADKIVTFHFNATDDADGKHDARWAAFVAEYDQNSTILSSTMVCMAG